MRGGQRPGPKVAVPVGAILSSSCHICPYLPIYLSIHSATIWNMGASPGGLSGCFEAAFCQDLRPGCVCASRQAAQAGLFLLHSVLQKSWLDWGEKCQGLIYFQGALQGQGVCFSPLHAGEQGKTTEQEVSGLSSVRPSFCRIQRLPCSSGDEGECLGTNSAATTSWWPQWGYKGRECIQPWIRCDEK